MNDVLENTYLGNTPSEWLTAGIIAAITFAVLQGIEWLVTRRFAKFAEASRFTFDDVIVAVLRATRFWFTLLIAVWAGSLAVELDETMRGRFETIVKLGLILQIGFWATAGIRAFVRDYSERRAESDPSGVTTMRAVGLLAVLITWVLLLLSSLAVLGFDITTLIAGLGIGGIAIALATQNILSDLFASLSIVLDKPFVIGDFIIVGTEMGTVEHIGLKTTRVRSISGEQLVFGNADLLASRVRNMKRMSERRVLFTVGVTYQTPRAQLIEIPQRIREIIEAQEDTRVDRSHFANFGPYSLDFEVVYFVKSPEFTVYRDRHQAIILAIHEYFENEGIEFAYPTQTILLAGSEVPAAASGGGDLAG